ncbi:MAG: betaine-aldehyde dehydrogenase [Alphaproteobacteria bacterium]|nr:betaine-aldehyde dehydrogenase [Alphaproteobacteria bacterium]
MSQTLSEIPLYLNGGPVASNGAERFPTRNPATGETLATVHQAVESDIAKAVEGARAGQKIWAAMTGAERGRVLNRAVALLRERNDDLARWEVLDNGKPWAEAVSVDVASGADAIEFFAGAAATLTGDHYDLGPGAFGYTRREPLGVCAGIGAWNYPIQIACWKSAPALACGNAMIFKPAELTPITAMELAKIYTEAGLPDGVFQVVQGDGRVGQMLTAHPGIAKVSLTGEVGTGRKVMSAAAATLKHVTLELGGKSPLIIFDDADLENAVAGAMMANFYTQGEVCSNGTRVFVQEAILPAFLEKMKARVSRLRIGSPMHPETDMGALISPEHLEKVLSYIEQGRRSGAELVCGGTRADGGGHDGTDLSQGCFVEPTIFAQCSDDMTIVTDEIFGPVMTVLAFKSESEVIERANATEYGLSAGVFTNNLARGHRVVAQLQAGTIWINNYNLTPVEMPFGGYKQSGLGRENSLAAIEHYTQLKSVYVELGDVESTL